MALRHFGAAYAKISMQSSPSEDQQRGLFAALQSLAQSPALLLDAHGALQHANPQACELFECPDEAALRTRWPQIAAQFGVPAEPPASPRVALYEADIALSNGSRALGLELHALNEQAGAGYFGLLRNRAVLDAFERELLMAGELRAWTHQRETLMHDLKGILNAMQISLELISDPDAAAAGLSPEEERKQRRINMLKQDLMRMDRSLRLLPGEEGHAEPPEAQFDLGEVIKDVFAALRQLVRRNHVALTLALPEAPVRAKGRRAWIRQALFSVAVHRLNAMRAGGPLVVEVAATDHATGVTMRDGVPDQREQIIDESRRMHGSARNNGSTSDLRVARAIVEAHGGALEIGSAEDGGTLIILRLPN